MALSAHQRIKSEHPIQLHKPAEEGHTTSVQKLSDPRREVIRPRYAGRTLYKPPQESPYLCVREFISSVLGFSSTATIKEIGICLSVFNEAYTDH